MRKASILSMDHKLCSVTEAILELYPSPVTGGLAKAFERLQPLHSITFAPAVVYGMSEQMSCMYVQIVFGQTPSPPLTATSPAVG